MYPDHESARRPTAHCDESPVPLSLENLLTLVMNISVIFEIEEEVHISPQKELNDLVCEFSF